jgi:ATP-dependent DNA helicase HFM1/MER3
MFSDENVLVCAPTATGKTVIMEMAILRELGVREQKGFKILYLAPIRALCQ